MKKTLPLWTTFLIIALLISSCKSPAPEVTSEAEAAAARTAAAKTAQAMLQGLGTGTGTATSATLKGTPRPAGTQPAATKAATSTTQAGATSGIGDKAEFVDDVTVPDKSLYQAGQPFTKTWLLKNTGSTTWTTQYSIVYDEGEEMGGPQAVFFPKPVAPGETVEVSVKLVAPEKPGEYSSYWLLKNNQGELFGVGETANDHFWANIIVPEAGTPGTPGAPTKTPGPQPTGAVVTFASLSVDNPEARGCPHSFTFTAQVTLGQASEVTLQLEAGTADPGYTIDQPAPTTANLAAGPNTILYQMSFNAGLDGWAQLKVTAPNQVSSNVVEFSLRCP